MSIDELAEKLPGPARELIVRNIESRLVWSYIRRWREARNVDDAEA